MADWKEKTPACLCAKSQGYSSKAKTLLLIRLTINIGMTCCSLYPWLNSCQYAVYLKIVCVFTGSGDVQKWRAHGNDQIHTVSR